MIELQKLLEIVIEKKASDLHITTGAAPQFRIDGKLVSLENTVMTAPDTKRLCYSVLTDAQRHNFEEEWELDFSFGIKGLSRFRGNIYMQRGAVSGAFRAISFDILNFSELGVAPIAGELLKRPKGLVLVTGPTGTGKSTTLAAMIDKINNEKSSHIVTIEDPIEYLHRHKSCIVNQREVKQDTKSFTAALRHILRQDPDIILIGEMRDLETINRIIDVFPPHQQTQIRTQLSFVLEGVLAQQLIPKIGGKGRALAMEVMIPNPAIRNLIREDKIQQIYSHMQVGQTKFGMQTMNQSLLSLVERHIISLEDAMERSHNLDEFRQMLSTSNIQMVKKERPVRTA